MRLTISKSVNLKRLTSSFKMVFSTKDQKLKKLELFKVPVLLIIIGKPQTLARGLRNLLLKHFITNIVRYMHFIRY